MFNSYLTHTSLLPFASHVESGSMSSSVENGRIDSSLSRSCTNFSPAPPRDSNVQKHQRYNMIGFKPRVVPIMIDANSSYGGNEFVPHGRHGELLGSSCCKQKQAPPRNEMKPYLEPPPKKRQARRSSLTDARWVEHLLKILESDTASTDSSSVTKGTDSSESSGSSSSMARASSMKKGPSDKPKRTVSFGDISIREYETTLSDHPMCSDGPPIGLDWSYTEQMAINIDDYEADKLMYQGPNRTRVEMWLSGSKRWNMLLSMGHTAKEIGEVSARSKRSLTKSSLWRTISGSRKKKLPSQ